MFKPLINIILTFLPMFLLGQEYNYVHYDTKDGLAGSTVYSVTQDRDGYLWFSTEYGISRFDGKSFKNFTTDNGLTDNEILNLEPDNKGRVWIIPYNKSLCYYYKGKIINADSLYHINIQTKIAFYGKCDYDNYFIVCNNKIYLLKNDGSKRILADLKDIANKYHLPSTSYDNIQTAYSYINQKLEYKLFMDNVLITIKDSGTVTIKVVNLNNLDLTLHNSIKYKVNSDHILTLATNFSGLKMSAQPTSDPNIYLVSTLEGSYLMDSTGNIDLKHPFLYGKKHSRVFIDNENNIWFATLGEGVYKLSSKDIKSFEKNGEVMSICADGDIVYSGSSLGTLFAVKNNESIKDYSFKQFDSHGQNRRLFCMKRDQNNTLFLGFDSYLIKLKNNQSFYSPIRPIKSIDVLDDKSIVVATNSYVFKINKSDLVITDTLLRERGTKVICDKGKIYIGTLKGVKVIDLYKKVSDLSDWTPIQNHRITDMLKADDGSLWIATNDTGIIHYSNGKILAHITTANKLSSNICRTLFLNQKYLWIGTNKGLNKLDISDGKYAITKYSESDGLPSNVINAVYAKDSTIYVGSPAGLTYFNENSISHSSICNLVLENITVSDKHLDSTINFHLDYQHNNISFNYNAISFKSGGDITYYYKLHPLDKNWKETRLTTLSYPSLPSGSFQLELYAINKFGKKSQTIVVKFDIDTPFWKTYWFLVFIFIICVLGVGFLIRNRYIKIQEINNEKARVKQQLAILEQSALQAQMNPHFIFNCLNSIQQFIMLNNKEMANKYLTEFAGLIRNTFDNSGKKYITVAEEAEYLDKYLDLEQLRYGDDFKYEIIIDNSVEKNFTEIPAMLLQPYIENCLRHGIRNKINGGGIVVVSFNQQDNTLICTISDNGVGRATALLLKSKEHIEYQSKGMNLTARRIELLNTALENKISVEVKDLMDNTGNSTGTEVIVRIPLT